MRDNAQNPNLPRRVGDRGNGPLSTPTTASASTAAADDELPGRIDGRGRRGLSSTAAAASTTPNPPLR